MAARSIEELQKRYASLGKLPKGGPGGGPRGRGGPRPKGKPKNSRATVRRLLGYIGAYRFRLIFVFLCMLCSTLTAMVGTYLLRDVYNVLTLPKDGEVSAHTQSILLKIFMPELAANATPTVEQRIGCLAIILGVLAAIYAIGIVSTYLQGRLMIAVSQNAVEKIRNDLFKKLQRLPVRYFDSHPTGELMSRFTNDVDAIDMMINSTVTSLISGTISLVGTVFMMFYTSWFLALITLLFVPLYLYIGSGDAADTGCGNASFVHRHAEGYIGRQDDLVPGIGAFHIGGRVGLSIAQRLGLLQHIAIVKTLAGHVIQNIVAGAVHDAPQLGEALNTAGTLQLRQPADAAADGSRAAERNAHILRQGQQLVIAAADQRLVGGDHIFAGFHGSLYHLKSRMHTADGFHHGVDLRVVDDLCVVLHSLHIGQVDGLQAQNLGDGHIFTGADDIINAPTHNAEAKQTDVHNFLPHKNAKTLAFLTDKVYHITK